MNSHGNISFSWNEDIFTLIVEGAFNEEGIETNVPLLKASVLNRPFSQWKRLEIWDMEVLGSPETIKKCQVIWDWFNEKGCSKTAFVVSNAVQISVLENYASDRSKTFLDKTKALEWLNKT